MVEPFLCDVGDREWNFLMLCVVFDLFEVGDRVLPVNYLEYNRCSHAQSA